MAKVHKAHKSSKKYSFQKKKLNVKTLLIVLAVVVVAAIGLKIAYDNYVYGEFEVAAPSNEQLNNIADNWAILNTHTDDFMNYYQMLGYSTDGTDGAGNVLLLYYGNENVDEVSLQIVTTEQEAIEPSASGAFARTSLTDFINGVAPWGQMQKQIILSNANCAISIYDADAEDLSTEIVNEIIAEIEAIIAEGPVVTEVPAEDAVEEAADEATEPAEETAEEAAEESAEAAE